MEAVDGERVEAHTMGWKWENKKHKMFLLFQP